MSRDNYKHIEDFLKDPTFIDWANQKDQNASILWEKWASEHPELREAVEQAKVIAKGLEFNPQYIAPQKVEAKWEKFNEARLKNIRKKEQQQRFLSSRKKVFWRVAATVALIIMTLGVYQYRLTQEKTYHTEYGERLEFQLPDGTEISLNANSTLRYVRNNPRKVWLEGEAFFKVKKKPKTGEHFLVVTDDLEVEVLGTVFNVNSRNEQTEVVLEEGKVKLDLKEQGTMLMKPGELVTYSSSKKNPVVHETVKSELHTSWKDGVLQFDNTPLTEALKTIEETYGVEVIFQDTTTSEKILNGGVPNDNLPVFIKTLKTIYGLDIEHQDGKLIIK